MLTTVHETLVGVANVEMTPPHPPREETPAYRRAHHFLIHEKKAGCVVCEVTSDTLASATADVTTGAPAPTQLETHHYPIERSLLDACDPHKVHARFPQVYDQATLEAFVDSPANLLVLCDVHHRHPDYGIHHLLTQDWVIQPFLKDGYQIAARRSEAAAALAQDEQLLQEASDAR